MKVESLMVKRVIRTEIFPLGVNFCIDQPKNNQMFVDNNLIISGWIIGESSLVDKIIVSGGISAEIPVDVYRPDVLFHFGDNIKNFCPFIEGTFRCGFSKKLPLLPIDAGVPVELAAMLQDGSKIPLAVIIFSKNSVIPESQPRKNPQFFYFGHTDAGYFLRSCSSLSDVYPSDEWPDLTARPLPQEKEKRQALQHYDVFVPILYEMSFAKNKPSVLEQLPEYVIEDLNNKKCSLILDYSNEPARWGLCAFIRNTLQDRGLQDFTNLMLIGQNRLLSEVFTDFCIYPFDYYIVESAIALHAQLDQVWNDRLNLAWRDGKAKDILCMNYVRRQHRWLTVATLIKKGMLTNSLVSFLGCDKKSVGEASLQDVLDFAAKTPDLQNLNEAIHWLAQNAPLKFDELTKEDDPVYDEMLYKIDFSVYEQTLLSIVTESGLNDTIQRVTEKTLKAFAIGHPSVIIGNLNSVKLVEELGFDVFHDFIDHSYDQIDNWVLRMNTAIDEAISFCDAWRSGSVDIDKLQTISQKNRDWLRDGFFEFYANRYAFPILSSLASKY